MKAGLVWLLLFALLPAFLFGLSWRADITFQDSDESRTIVWGLAPDATDGFDIDIDENFPLIPPSGLYAYFALNDPAYPFITMLSEDVRQDEIGVHYWRATFGGTSDPVAVSWNPLAIPMGTANYGIGTESEAPTEWNDMTAASSVSIGSGQYFWISFVPGASGSDNPPYVVSTNPTDGATNVMPNTDVQIVLADDETGIDISSLVLTVDSEDVTSDAVISRDGGTYTITYTPTGGFDEHSTVNVNIYGEDISTAPSSVDYSFSFTTGALPTPVLWEVPITINSVTTGYDTTDMNLSFGVVDGGSDNFDVEYDIPYPMPPAGAFYAYFPLNDPDYSFFTMLTRDIRATGVDNVWNIRFGNPGADVWADWSGASLPEDVLLEIGVDTAPNVPTEWFNMSDITSIAISSDQWLWVRQSVPPIPDTLPPYLVSSIPAVGETGVSLSTNLTIVITDDGAGVDLSSIALTVDGVDVTTEASITESDSNVYIVYNPPADFSELYLVNWSVDVSDLADTPNSTTIDGYFTTGFFPSPNWLGTLVFDITPSVGSPYQVHLDFGTDEAGTDGYDIGLDYISPPPIPGAPMFYFYITDTLWEQLQRDIRSSAEDSIMWVAYCTGIDLVWGTYSVSWNPDSLPVSNLMYAWTDLTTEPSEWTSMEDVSSFDIEADGRLFILYKTAPTTYCLSGTVTLEDTTEDLAGTIVSIDELGLADTTDETGAYEICGIEAGTYNVTFQHDGYVQVDDSLAIMDDMIYDITLNLPRYTVSGQVALDGIAEGNWDGTSVQLDADVVLTDTSGYYSFSGLLAGDYMFHAEHDGYISFDTTLTVDSDITFDLTLHQAGNITVFVDLEGDGDLSGTQVIIVENNDTAFTDASGYATFSDVEYGDYTIDVSHTNYVSQILNATLDSPAETLSTTLNLKRGTIEGFAMLSDSPVDLSGTVVTLDSSDVTYTDITGYYQFDNVIYGDHNLVFTHDTYETIDTNITLADPGTLQVDVTLIKILLLNPPQNLQTFSRHHNRISLRWQPPEATEAHLLGYGIIRSWLAPSDTDTIATLPKYATSYIDRDVNTGLTDYYWYKVYAIYEEGYSEAIGPRVAWAGDNPNDPDVLIVDFDNGANLANGATEDEAAFIANNLETAVVDGDNIVAQVTTQDEDLDSFELSLYKAVIIITGIYDSDDTQLSQNSLAKVLDYIGAGGRIYWEGADVAYTYETADTMLFSRFGVTMADDGNRRGIGNVSELFGNMPFFFNNLSLHYDYRTWADHWVDELGVVGPTSFAMLNSQTDPAPNVSTVRMIANDASELGYSSAWKSVISSVYLGAIQVTDQINNYWEVMRGIWNFLTGEDIGAYVGIDESQKPFTPANITLLLAPTPFNSALEISVDVKRSTDAELFVSDIDGRKVATISTGQIDAGAHTFVWNADDAPSGIYFVILKSAENTSMQKAVLIR